MYTAIPGIKLRGLFGTPLAQSWTLPKQGFGIILIQLAAKAADQFLFWKLTPPLLGFIREGQIRTIEILPQESIFQLSTM